LTPEHIDNLADLAENCMDMDLLLRQMPHIPAHSYPSEETVPQAHVRIGVAWDKAFCFYYQDNLDLLTRWGARIVRFSPLGDTSLPENLDGLYFGGGYPELFPKKLADNGALHRQIREKSRQGMPIYAECGGFMFLCRELRDLRGKSWPMTGIFPFTTGMTDRLKALGYREIRFNEDNILGKAGQWARGHEFHYSDIIPSSENEEIKVIYRVSGRTQSPDRSEGYMTNRTLGSYIHLHFASRPEIGRNFVETCARYQQERIRA
jgi:cobyrinic acid a,c-diamide synthase